MRIFKSAKTQALLAAFDTIKFHVSDASHENGEGDCYCVASFGGENIVHALADLLDFDEYSEWSKMDNEGNMILDDNGCPFTSAEDTIKSLLEVFKTGIEGGLVTEAQIRSQVQIWSDGVCRSVFSREQLQGIVTKADMFRREQFWEIVEIADTAN